MHADTIRQHLEREPFAPFTLFLHDGTACTAPRPDFAFFAREGHTHVLFESPQRSVRIDAATIARIVAPPSLAMT